MLEISIRLQEELTKLIEIAKNKKYKVNFSTVLNILSEQKFDLNNIDEIYHIFTVEGIEVISDDVEIDGDLDADEIGEKIKPFDQTKIDIMMKALTLDLLIKRLDNSEINLITEFQRKQGLWDPERKSRLIESLMLKIPLPAFYFDGENNDCWLVIDGLQRLGVIKEFFVDKTLRLSKLEFLEDYNGCNVDQLPRSYVRRMEETQVTAYIVNPGTPINVKYNIFKRINTGGLELVPQEIRHALHQGKASKLLEALANNEYFLKATDYSIKGERMLDREFVLRFIAFSELGVDKYRGPIDNFLNDAMEMLNKCNEDKIDSIKDKFNQGIRLAYLIFNKYCFRKMIESERRSPINKALYDAWGVILSKLDLDQAKRILNNREEVVSKFKAMCLKDEDFLADIGSGKIISVKRRFEKIEKLVMECL
jgi:hypothetical protein